MNSLNLRLRLASLFSADCQPTPDRFNHHNDNDGQDDHRLDIQDQ